MNSIFIFLFFATLYGSVSANHVNCTTNSCRDLCSFHGEWVNDSYCACDDLYYTLESHQGHDDLTNHLTVPCSQRRKSQLTAFVLHTPVFAPFGAAYWYIGNTPHAIGYIVLFFVVGPILGLLVFCFNKELTGMIVQVFVALAYLIFLVWYIVDLVLFATNYYHDRHGETLYPW